MSLRHCKTRYCKVNVCTWYHIIFEFSLVHCAYEHLQQICRVCSSEKVDKWARYAEFLIASMPYPGKELVQWHTIELKELLYVYMLCKFPLILLKTLIGLRLWVLQGVQRQWLWSCPAAVQLEPGNVYIAGNFWGWKLSQLLRFCGYSKVFSMKFVGVVSFGGTST